MMINIFNLLQEENKFSPIEQVIINYILEHPYDILNMNAKELAKRCFVPVSSVYRLCDKLELSGFSDLKVKVSNSLHDYQKDDSFNFDFSVNEYQSDYEIMTKIKEDYEKTLDSTFNLFSLEELKKAVLALKKAKTIDIYTSAGNINFASNFQFQMKEIGVDVNVFIESYQQVLYASVGDKTHLAIIISFEGRGILNDDLIRILKDTRTPVLLICAFDFEFKDFKPDYHLYICSNENHYKKISSYSTRLSILYILDVLYTCYFELDYQ